MDRFFIFELATPILFSFAASILSWRFFRRIQVRGYRWNFLFSFILLVGMIAVWVSVGRYSNRYQCEAAYGAWSADPKMCDNPANGIKAMLQVPLLILIWFNLSAFSFLKFRSWSAPKEEGANQVLAST